MSDVWGTSSPQVTLPLLLHTCMGISQLPVGMLMPRDRAYRRHMDTRGRRAVLAVPVVLSAGLMCLISLSLDLRAHSTSSICALASTGCSRKWPTLTSTPLLIVFGTALLCSVIVFCYLRVALLRATKL